MNGGGGGGGGASGSTGGRVGGEGCVHGDLVRSVALGENFVLSGSYDLTIKVSWCLFFFFLFSFRFRLVLINGFVDAGVEP